MREIIPFCIENDPSPPNFVELLIQEKKFKIRPLESQGLDDWQQKQVDNR